MGQTERGSFVATVIAPVPPVIQPSLPFDGLDASIETGANPRRVTTLLMSSLGLVSSAIQLATPNQILDGVEQGCER